MPLAARLRRLAPRRPVTARVPTAVTQRALAAYYELAQVNKRPLVWASFRPGHATLGTLDDAYRPSEWPLTDLTVPPSAAQLRAITEYADITARLQRPGLAEALLLVHTEIREAIGTVAAIARVADAAQRADTRTAYLLPDAVCAELTALAAGIHRSYEFIVETVFHGAYLDSATPETLDALTTWLTERFLPAVGPAAYADLLAFLGEVAANDRYELILGRGHPTRTLVTHLAAHHHATGWPVAAGPAMAPLLASPFGPLRESALLGLGQPAVTAPSNARRRR